MKKDKEKLVRDKKLIEKSLELHKYYGSDKLGYGIVGDENNMLWQIS